MPDAPHIVLTRADLRVFGGAERLMLAEAEYFQERGYEVTVLVNGLDRSSFGDRLDGLTVEHVDVASYGDLGGLYRYRKALGRLDPDVVIAHETSQEYLFVATLGTDLPVYFHRHDSPFWFMDNDRIYSYLYRDVFDEIVASNWGHQEFIDPTASFGPVERLKLEARSLLDYLGTRNAKKIITVCEQSQWEIEKMYGKESVVLHPGASADLFADVDREDTTKIDEIRSRHGIDETDRVITTVNRLDPRKRIDLLVRSVARLLEESPDVHLVVGGKGPERERIEALVADLGIEESVTFTGFIPDEELPYYFLLSDVVTYQIWGSWGLVPVEALSLDSKVVLTSDSGATEVRQYAGENVFVTDPDAEDMVAILQEALAADAAETRERILTDLSWERYFGLVEAEIDELRSPASPTA